MTTDYSPTTEQQAALDLFRTGQSLVIEAGAGTGKTSTLRMLADSTDAPGLYVAFNKAIVTESAGTMPRNVFCATAHALAYRAVGAQYSARLDAHRMKSAEIARILCIDPIRIQAPAGSKRLAPGWLGGHVLRAVSMFCQSADREPNERHFPYIEGIDSMTPDGRRGYANNSTVARALLPALVRAWTDLNNTTGDLPFKHEHYLKIWHLSNPRLAYDFIMFDEAQDASPVMADVIESQSGFGTQLVFVGDSQQSIYGFTGAVNALAQLDTPNRTMLTKSWRFGPQIAAVANRVLSLLESDLLIEGAGPAGRIDKLAAPDVVLCRTNATAVRTAMAVLQDDGRPAIVGGADEVVRFAKACEGLRTDGWTSHPELSCFKTWGEVQDYVDDDPNGSDLALLVRLVDEFGADIIIDSLEQCSVERDATVTISTAHKAKGREWDDVQLADDFPTGFDKDGNPIGVQPEELRLLYVAATRARRVLDTGNNPLLSPAPKVVRIVDGVIDVNAVDAEPLAGTTLVNEGGFPALNPGAPAQTGDEVARFLPIDQLTHGTAVRVFADGTGRPVIITVDEILPAPPLTIIGGADDKGERHTATLQNSSRVLVVNRGAARQAAG